MAGLKFVVDGRERPLSDFGDVVKDAVEKQARVKTIPLIESVRCPVHGEQPRNVQMAMDDGRVRWTFEKCCSELEKAVAAALPD